MEATPERDAEGSARVTAGTGTRGPDAPAKPSFRNTFASFAHRNYRLWFVGQVVSLMGTWMQTTAQGFLVYQLTSSPLWLGAIGFASGIPIWLFTLVGGVVSDRVPRRTLLIATQSAMTLLAFLLAGLTFLGWVRPWHILLLAFGTGTVNAFDAPARQAFVSELVSRDKLTNAIALNSTMFNLGTAVGPAVAGFLYAWLGPAWCFTINGFSFFAVIAALAAMRFESRPPAPAAKRGLADFTEGLRFVAKEPVIRLLIVTIAFATLFASSFATLFPAWAVEVLRGDARTNGLLQSLRGFGSLFGALAVASFGRTVGKGRFLTLGSFLFPAALFGWALVTRTVPSLMILFLVGAGMMFVVNVINALIQSRVPDQLRGRVMSVYTLFFFGSMPIGSLLMGAVAHAVGEPAAVMIGAGITLAFASFLYLRFPTLRSLP